jgi:hypothetical protein
VVEVCLVACSPTVGRVRGGTEVRQKGGRMLDSYPTRLVEGGTCWAVLHALARQATVPYVGGF